MLLTGQVVVNQLEVQVTTATGIDLPLGSLVDLGSVVRGQTGPRQSFIVRNTGTRLLTLGSIVVPTGFRLVSGLPSSLSPGASATFTVQLLSTTSAGVKTGTLRFATNDADERTFIWR